MTQYLKVFSVTCLIIGMLAACATEPKSTPRLQENIRYQNKSAQRSLYPPPIAAQREQSALIDPLEAHMLARKDVHPNEPNYHSRYVSTSNPYKRKPNTRTASSSTQQRFAKKTNAQTKQKRARVTPPSSQPVPTPSQKPRGVILTSNPELIIPANRPVAAPENTVLSNVTAPKRKPSGVQAITRKASAVPQNHAVGAKSIIKSVRVGDHTDKTRIVFDSDNAYDFTVQTDNSGRRLIITLKNAYWGTQLSKRYQSSSILNGYNVNDGDKSVQVVFDMATAIRPLKPIVFPPSKVNNGYRLVFDVVPQS